MSETEKPFVPPAEAEESKDAMRDDEDRDGKKKKKRKKRSRSRSRSRSRGRKKKRARRSRSKSRERRRTPSPRRRSPSPMEHFEEMDEEMRTELTAFVQQIHPSVDERDLFDFFSNVGRVEDIRLIRDARSGKSKGLAYVQFAEKNSIPKACALSGTRVGGFPLTIVPTPTIAKKDESQGMRLYIGNIHYSVTEEDLKPVFEAFGPLDSLDLHKDTDTQISKGFGFVTYKKEADAVLALQKLNGYVLAGGEAMKVGMVDSMDSKAARKDVELGDMDEGAGGLGLTSQSRAQLMAKLQRGESMLPGIASAPAAATPHSSRAGLIANASAMSVPMIQPSTCIVVKNMFNAEEETEPEWDLDIRDDVKEELSKHGTVKHIFVDRNSQGFVYLRFDGVQAATAAQKDLHGRWFASRQISAEFVIESTYMLKFPDAA